MHTIRVVHHQGETPQMPTREEKTQDWEKMPQAVEGQLVVPFRNSLNLHLNHPGRLLPWK